MQVGTTSEPFQVQVSLHL